MLAKIISNARVDNESCTYSHGRRITEKVFHITSSGVRRFANRDVTRSSLRYASSSVRLAERCDHWFLAWEEKEYNLYGSDHG